MHCTGLVVILDVLSQDIASTSGGLTGMIVLRFCALHWSSLLVNTSLIDTSQLRSVINFTSVDLLVTWHMNGVFVVLRIRTIRFSTHVQKFG